MNQNGDFMRSNIIKLYNIVYIIFWYKKICIWWDYSWYLFCSFIYQSVFFYRMMTQITSYTQWIYSLHLILKVALNSKIDVIKKGYLYGNIAIHIFSYLISFIGGRIFTKTKLYNINYYQKIRISFWFIQSNIFIRF